LRTTFVDVINKGNEQRILFKVFQATAALGTYLIQRCVSVSRSMGNSKLHFMCDEVR